MTTAMRIIFDPSVYLIGTQTITNEALDAFLADHNVKSWTTDTDSAGEKLCEVAGRLCYMSYSKPRPGGNKAYIEHIKEVGHGSVLEHSVYSFIFTGISRSLTHELVRHRAGLSPSQLSQRYVDESVAEYVCPPAYRQAVELYMFMHDYFDASLTLTTPTISRVEDGNTLQNDRYNAEARGLARLKEYNALYNQTVDYSEMVKLYNLGYIWYKNIEKAHTGYVDLVAQASLLWPEQERKEIRQAARSVLPNATETKIQVTVNARALRHFFEMRASKFADTEIRKLAVTAFKVVKPQASNLFNDYSVITLADGTEALETKYKKV